MIDAILYGDKIIPITETLCACLSCGECGRARSTPAEATGCLWPEKLADCIDCCYDRYARGA